MTMVTLFERRNKIEKQKKLYISLSSLFIVAVAVLSIAIITDKIKSNYKITSPTVGGSVQGASENKGGTGVYDSQSKVSGLEKFEFNLKENYSSREEVLAEDKRLTDAYYAYEVGKSADEYKDAFEEYKSLQKVLGIELLKFLPSDEEILAQKEKRLNQRVWGYEEDIFYYEKNENKDEQVLNNIKTLYNQAVSVRDDYNSGKITIDKALEELGITV